MYRSLNYEDYVYKDFTEITDMFEIQISPSLIPLVKRKTKGKTFLERLYDVRKHADVDYGLPIPPVHVTDNMCLGPYEYAIYFNGVEQERYKIPDGYYYCIDIGDIIPDIVDCSKYEKTTEPSFGMVSYLVPKEDKDLFEKAGYLCVFQETIITTHLFEIIKKNRTKILTQCMVNELTEKVRQLNPDVFTDVFFNHKFPVSDLKILLNTLLEEYVSIRDMNTILEAVADYLQEEKNPLKLAEKVRVRLAYSFIKNYMDKDFVVHAIKVSENLSNILCENVYYPKSRIEPPNIALKPDVKNKVVESITASLKEIKEKGYAPTILCDSSLRLPFATFAHQYFPGIPVFSDVEIVSLNCRYLIKFEGEIFIE